MSRSRRKVERFDDSRIGQLCFVIQPLHIRRRYRRAGWAPEALAAQLEGDELDLAILNPLDGLGGNYRAEALYTERYVVLLPPTHPFRERNALTLRDLSNQPYVDRLSCEMREMVMGVCEDMAASGPDAA